MNWRAVDLVAWVLMLIWLAVGVVLFLQDTDDRRVMLCVATLLSLSLLGRYARNRSTQAQRPEASPENVQASSAADGDRR